jgi:hypothetical protein
LTGSESVFVAELYIDRRDIAPILFPFAITFPDPLYANAFF